jgi:effector-binding domain-containing protein
MIKIGDFSKLSQVTVKTLHHYDQLGLLKPVHDDRFTGYRYYAVEQLPRLNRILALKDLGLSLQQIAQLLADDLPATEIRGMLKLKQAEVQQQLVAEQARLARIEVRLRQIEQEQCMPTHEVVIKKIEPQLVAGVRDVIPDRSMTTPVFNRLFDEVLGYVEQQGGKFAGPALDLWHDMEHCDRDIQVEAAVPIQERLPASDRVRVYELPAVETMASVIHQGSFDGFGEAYSAILQWIEANGYRIVGPNREIYLQYDRTGNPAEYVTEIQFPVAKA